MTRFESRLVQMRAPRQSIGSFGHECEETLHGHVAKRDRKQPQTVRATLRCLQLAFLVSKSMWLDNFDNALTMEI